MKKQYMSMQEELAARRAASENQTTDQMGSGPSRTASGHFERTNSAAGRRHSGGNRQVSDVLDQLTDRLEQWIGGSATETFRRRKDRNRQKTFPSVKRSDESGGFGGPGGSGGTDPRREFRARNRRGALKVLGAAFAATLIIVFISMFLIGNGPEDTYESTPEPPESTWDTGTESGDLNESSSMVDIENYVAEITEPNEDEDSIYGQAYSRIDRYIMDVDSDCNWYVSDGRIYIWPSCDKTDDPDEVIETWTGVTDTIYEILEETEAGDTPVIIPVKDADGWENLIILIDGEAVFISDELGG